MSKRVYSLFYRVTGGRPMRLVRKTFRDVVTGEQVGYWLDGNGNHWLATGPWSIFRVKPMHGPEIWERQP